MYPINNDITTINTKIFIKDKNKPELDNNSNELVNSRERIMLVIINMNAQYIKEIKPIIHENKTNIFLISFSYIPNAFIKHISFFFSSINKYIITTFINIAHKLEIKENVFNPKLT